MPKIWGVTAGSGALSLYQAENEAQTLLMNREKGNCGKNNQCPVLPTFLFKMLLVQHHLVEGGWFGKEVMNKPASLEFAVVLRACCERTELIYKFCEQLDCNAAAGLDYFLQKEKFPQKGRETL